MLDDENNEQTTETQTEQNDQSQTQASSSPPPSQPIDSDALRAELDRLGRQALSEQAQTIQRLQNELNDARNTRTAAPEQQDPARFFENPRQIIREELQQVVAPLLQFQRTYEQESEYSKLKRQALSSPQLGHLLRDVEGVVDQMMEGQQPTAQNLQAAIFTALGLKSANMLPQAPATPVQQPFTQQVQPVSNPPYIPPSPPPAPRSGPRPNQGPVLTESERQIAKQWNMTPEEYVQLRDADPDVATWPREKKNGS